MSFIECSFFSKVLKKSTKITICLPAINPEQALSMPLTELYQKRHYKLLVLLHGMFGDNTSWYRHSNVERYASPKNIAVVMPSCGSSYGLDMVHGDSYFTFLTQELPLFLKVNFGLDTARENCGIAGLSMGGYAACRCAFLRPDLYCFFASLSGSVDIEEELSWLKKVGMENLISSIFGNEVMIKGTDTDLFYLSEKLVASQNPLPKGYLACGTEDEECYPMTQKLKAHLERLSYPFQYHESHGKHKWDFWEKEIQNVLNEFA